MSRRLPPLNALRTFEAAARHLSFAKAAEELSVTSAAVSHQIKLLESVLGTRLFTRSKHSVALTDAARACLPHLSQGFDQLCAAMDLLHRLDRGAHLRVAVGGSFAAKWLVPRLAGFQAAQPGVEVEVVVSDDDALPPGTDAAILYGRATPAGFHAAPLLGEHLVAVCAPALLAGLGRPPGPADVAAFPLLHDGEPPEEEACPDWGAWCAALGLGGIDARRGSRFNRSALAVDAALAGQGIALTRRAIAARALAAGRLVAPFAPGMPTGRQHVFVCPAALAHSPRVRAFAHWLRREAALDQGSLNGGKNTLLSLVAGPRHHAAVTAAPPALAAGGGPPC